MNNNAAIFEEYDVLIYYREISREGYHQISTVLEKKIDKKDKVCLILITYGGDPDAGYRIARALKFHYKTVEILIPDMCKSAGTLVCIGADRLIIGDRGELGPLDIQLSKPDEILGRRSGLDIIQAISALEYRVISSFRSYLFDICTESRLTTKMAADIAAKLTEGFISPIAEKIDPIMLGEHQRAMKIAFDYGKRLDDMAHSLRENALNKLVSSYPCHSFVIDRREAETIFKNVVPPVDKFDKLYDWVIREFLEMQQHIVCDIQDIIKKTNTSLDNQQNLSIGENHEHSEP